MFAPKPALLKGAFKVLDGVSRLTNLPEEGKGPWVHDKDSKEQYDYVILGGICTQLERVDGGAWLKCIFSYKLFLLFLTVDFLIL